jgi:hypothetical protein
VTRAVSAPPGGWTFVEHPSPEDLDWGLIDQLQGDRTLVDLAEVAAMCGMASRQSAWHWHRAAQNYLLRGYREWPPSSQALRNEVDGGRGTDTTQPRTSGSAPYFTHPNVLPPADISGAGRGQDRWYKGTIYRWGMKVRRISPTGDPMPRTSGAPPGRGPVRGRAYKPRREDTPT